MDKIHAAKEFTKIACLIAITVSGMLFIHDARDVVKASLGIASTRIGVEGDATRKMIAKVAVDLAKLVEKHADHLQETSDRLADQARKDVVRFGDRLIDRADKRLASVEKKLDDQLTTANGNLNDQLGRTNDSVARVAGLSLTASSILSRVDQGLLPVLTDCDWQGGNPNCFENRWRGISWNVEEALRSLPPTMKAVETMAKETAGTTAEIRGIATDVHAVTTELVGPKPWYKKLWGATKTIVGAGALLR